MDLEALQFEEIDGDADVLEGVRVLLTPGHSPGSQIVVVETARGSHVIAGDTVTHHCNMEVRDAEPFWPGSIHVDLAE